ncbi:MAG: hypothetical protein M5U28_30940 [Sandaracinaceae bacterium]|nr:hypothetical protein [Sandaracinaceae bacterium]
MQVGLSFASFAALGALGVALFSLVQGARAELLAAMHGSALPASGAARVAAAVDVQLGALFLGSIAMAVAAPVAIAAVALPLRRPSVIVAAASALCVSVGALVCAAYAYEIGVGLSALANADPAARGLLVRALLERAETHLDLGRVVIVVSAAVAALAAWERAAREGVAKARGWIGAASLFVAGVVAFAATRDLAHDAEHPLANDGIPRVRSLPGLDVPELERCTDLSPAPTSMLVLQRGIALLDGRPAASPDALLVGARRGGDALSVECDAATPIAEVTPWLRAAHRGGHDDVLVVGQRVTRLETRTQGRLVEREVCDAVLALDASGQGLGRYTTWAALARAAERARGELRVAP